MPVSPFLQRSGACAEASRESTVRSHRTQRKNSPWSRILRLVVGLSTARCEDGTDTAVRPASEVSTSAY